MTTPDYDTNDLLSITNEQRDRERDFVNSEPAIGFLDTDLINIRIWWDVRFGFIPEEIDEHLRSQKERGYLLLRADLLWQYDELRDPKLNREELFECHRTVLEHFGFDYRIVEGKDSDRVQSAVNATEAFLRCE